MGKKLNRNKTVKARKGIIHILKSIGVNSFNGKPLASTTNEDLGNLYNKHFNETLRFTKATFANVFENIGDAAIVGFKKSKEERRKEYNDYLNSQEWAQKRKDLFAIRGKQCEICGSKKDIHVHHLHYKNIFKEEFEDLQVVCESCHSDIHGRPVGKRKAKKDSLSEHKGEKPQRIKICQSNKTIHLSKRTNNMKMSAKGQVLHLEDEDIELLEKFILDRIEYKRINAEK